LKPVEKEKIEKKPEEIRLKSVSKTEKLEELKPEQVVSKVSKEEKFEKKITLESVKEEKTDEKSEEIRFKPMKKIEKPKDLETEDVVLKPITRLSKLKETKEQIVLKPVEKGESKEIRLQPVSEIVTEKIDDKPTETKPMMITETPWRRKRTKKVVDFKEEVTIVPIDQEESVTEICEEKETMIITTEDTQDLIEKKMEPIPLRKEDKVTDEVITSEVSWRKKKQICSKIEEEKETVVLKPVERTKELESKIKQSKELVLNLVEDKKLPEEIEIKLIDKEKLTEEKFKENKIIELKPVKTFTDQIAEISEEKDEVIIESAITKSKVEEKMPDEITSNIIEKQLVEDVQLQIKADTQVEDRKRKRKQKRTQVDISIIDKDKTIAPRFIQKLQPVIAELKKPAKFTCTVIGNPFPEISWYKNEQELHTSEKYTMTIFETTATLEITRVKEEDAGMYSCRASNPAGVATSTVNLVIFGNNINNNNNIKYKLFHFYVDLDSFNY